jgi:hypothetical protein
MAAKKTHIFAMNPALGGIPAIDITDNAKVNAKNGFTWFSPPKSVLYLADVLDVEPSPCRATAMAASHTFKDMIL